MRDRRGQCRHQGLEARNGRLDAAGPDRFSLPRGRHARTGGGCRRAQSRGDGCIRPSRLRRPLLVGLLLALRDDELCPIQWPSAAQGILVLRIVLGDFFVVAIIVGLAIDGAAGNLSSDKEANKPIATGTLAVVYYFGTLLPGIAARIRRLHDIGLSGWIILIALIPYLGGIALFIMSLLPSEDRTNKHGPSPLPSTYMQS